VDDGNVRDGDALGHDEEDVATSFDADWGSAEVPAPAARPGRRRSAGSRVEATPAQCTARRKIPFRMSWRSALWGQGGTTHGMVEVGVAKGCPIAALHGGGVGGQHGQAKMVPEAGLDLSALELQSSREGEGDQPSRGRTAGAAKKACSGALAPVCA
jgi:hypothetical protein